jgi:hypothetical protein
MFQPLGNWPHRAVPPWTKSSFHHDGRTNAGDEGHGRWRLLRHAEVVLLCHTVRGAIVLDCVPQTGAPTVTVSSDRLTPEGAHKCLILVLATSSQLCKQVGQGEWVL